MKLTWQQIYWPSIMDPADALQLLRHLAADRRNQRIIFEARSGPNNTVLFFVGTQEQLGDYLSQLIGQHIRGATVTTPDGIRESVHHGFRLRLSSRVRPLRIVHAIQTAKSILLALTTVKESEQLTLQIILRRRIRPRAVPTRTSEAQVSSWWQAFTHPQTTKTHIDREKRTAYRLKVGAPGFICTLSIGVAAKSQKRRSDSQGNHLTVASSGTRSA